MSSPTKRSARFESAAFYIIFATVVLAPLAFWASQYFALESMKTIVIALGTIISAALLLGVVIQERETRLPPRSMLWIGLVLAISTVLSSSFSGHFFKSFFGQGFELGTGSFFLVLMLASLVAYRIVLKRSEHAVYLYAATILPFLILYVFHVLRFIFGAGFLSLGGILTSVTSTVLGSWYGLAMYGIMVIIIALSAVLFLPLSSRSRAWYWVLIVLSAGLVYVINSSDVWNVASLIFFGLTVYISMDKMRASGKGWKSMLGHIAWVPLAACLVAALLSWQGLRLAEPAVNALHAGYSELALPWQMTMDVASSQLKTDPILGAGPNRFTQVFLANKPAGINPTDAWSVEFGSGFGYIPTFLVTQGILGGILWVVFFVFFGILGVRSLRGLFDPGQDASAEPGAGMKSSYARFVIVSSYTSATFLWIMAIIYVPSHVLLFEAFIMTGIWLGASVACGRLRSFDVIPAEGSRSSGIMSTVSTALLVIVIIWGVVYVKNTSALAYFGSGVKDLTASGDASAADAKFARALALNPLDVYWQARAEASLAMTNKVIASVSADSSASTSQAAALKAVGLVNQAFGYANNAIKADSDNYYNYLSQARVAELATSLNMNNGLDAAVAAYTSAIRLNPQNPSIYVSLARLYASKNQYDQAIQTIGASLQVKNNYLDAVFLLSQVEAAKGNLADAITAATFATQLNSTNPLVFFQLGLLEYTKGDYTSAAAAFTQALIIEPGYANAQYFMGLADARLGKRSEAIAIFSLLAQNNPDNADVAQALSTLRAGKPLFGSNTVPALTPEKQARPPVPTK